MVPPPDTPPAPPATAPAQRTSGAPTTGGASRPRHHYQRRAAETGWSRARSALRTLLRGVWRCKWVLLLTAAYTALGAWLALRADLVVLDSLSRTAHAYFVWHNGPAKLAAIGLVWPPVTTMSLLPTTVLPELGRSGLAAPLVSAFVAAFMVWLAWWHVRRMGCGRALSLLLAALLAVQPMIVYYAANGMSDMWALALPVIAVAHLIRYEATNSTVHISIAGFASALAVMSRYELGLVVAVVGIGIYLVTLEHGTRAEAWAKTVLFLMPIVYAGALWMYFNWALQGSPVWFLTGGGQIATVAGTEELQGSATPALRWLAIVHGLMTPAAIFVTLGLLTLAVTQRRWLPLLLAAATAYNPATNLALIIMSGNIGLTQLRYNMRALPMVIITGAWLITELHRRGHLHLYRLTAATFVALLLAGYPGTIWLMRHHEHQFLEQAFLHAITHDQSLSGQRWLGGQTTGCDGARKMGAYISDNVRGADTILTDDSATYAVMLFSGHPERFTNSIDRGQAYLVDQVARPSRKVRYLLSTDRAWCSGAFTDVIAERYSDSLHSEGVPGLTLLHEERGFRLWKLRRSEFIEYSAIVSARAKVNASSTFNALPPSDE